MHKLTMRQLKRHTSFTEHNIPPELSGFINAINQAYSDMDDERDLFERSMDLSNKELFQRNQELIGSKEILEQYNQKLEEQVAERTKELKIALEEAQKGRVAAETASKMKSEFLANMSHELRTPLNSLLILSELLVENETNNLTPSQVESASVIHGSGQDLLTLINDILDLAKVEAGKMNLYVDEVKIDHITMNIKSKFTPMASKKQLDLIIVKEDNLPDLIRSDKNKIEQVIRNLISNALKFTPQGSITVRIFRPSADTLLHAQGLLTQHAIGFAVSDTGIGIPKDKQELIFEAFSQADGSTNRKYGGTGLGLSISREFSKLLGGEIQLTSEEGKGSTFTLFVPENVTYTQDASNAMLSNSSDNNIKVSEDDLEFLANKKVLVVDDDMRNIFALSKLLSTFHMKVTTATDGPQALIDLLCHSPDIDLVLMDIMMPDVDGYEIIKRIRQQKVCDNIPIIAVTAKAMKEDRDKCLAIGATEYLSKPIDRSKLVAALIQHLKG